MNLIPAPDHAVLHLNPEERAMLAYICESHIALIEEHVTLPPSPADDFARALIALLEGATP